MNSELKDRRTLLVERAGDHCLSKMSRQIDPFELIFGWYILVVNVNFAGLNGYSYGNLILKLNSPPA